MRNWILAKQEKPKPMVDVLVYDKYGEIFKAFQNSGRIWIMQNTNSLPSWYYKDENSIIAWMKLPEVYKKGSDEGWILTSDRLPDEHEPVLISTADGVYISHVRGAGSAMWWMRNRNERGVDAVYLFNTSVIAWMPLPEKFEEK